MIRVAIVARSAVLRSGLETLLGGAPDVVVVGAVAGPRADGGDDGGPGALLEVVAPLAPAVVVWALDRGGVGEAVAALRAGEDAPGSDAAVLLLVDPADSGQAARALRAGARAVLGIETGAEGIVAAVEAVAAGLVVVPADTAAALLAAVPAEPAHDARRGAPAGISAVGIEPAVALSPREREVLDLLARGLANKAIAPRLGISEHTVKAHVASIFEKLGAGTRAEAVATAARLGVLML